MRRPAPQPSVQRMHIPAPIGGLNTVAAGTDMPEGDCPVLFNMVSGEHGLRVRLGSKEYCHFSIDGGPTDGTLGLTLVGYHGSTEDGGRDRFFVITPSGIWDCSRPGDVGILAVAFAAQFGRVGYGTAHAFVTAAGHFLLYCDEVNGYHVYTESTDTWAKVAMGGGGAEISGVNPANLVFVMVWKSRVWFVEKDSKNAWYLAAGSIYGVATKLDLDRAAQFRNGGDLVGLWNWTLDGGIGIDDHLVAIARGGDVAVYQGSDPSDAATFALKGTWNAGAFVSGRRIATAYGGDILLLTRSGPRPLSQLVNGGDGDGTYVTGKVGNVFSRLAYERGHLNGWDMFIHPDEHALIITVPVPGTQHTEFFAMSLGNRSWSFHRDLQMTSCCVWRNQVYFSWADAQGYGSLFKSEGNTDFVPAVGIGGVPIQWSLITSFRHQGGNLVQVELIRPTLKTLDSNPSWEANARYNYNLAELDAVTRGTPDSGWDVGLWDDATWDSDFGPTDNRAKGATGIGNDFAIALRGASTSATVLVGIDVYFKTGGAL